MVNVKNMTIAEFQNSITSHKVVCFCGGQELRKLCDKYPAILPQLIYVVDNYNYDRVMEIRGYQIPVISMNQIDKQIKTAILIISSVSFAKELVLQLDELEICNGLEVYIPYFFREEEKVYVADSNKQVIPKKIHYCWFGKGEIPEQFQRNIETWKKYCPDYEIIRWDESNYDYTKNEYMRQAYESKRWGFVPDYARLDIIYTHGGIYLDTDVEIIKSFDSLLQYSMFCGFENEKFIALGLGFGAVAGNKVLQKMMDMYNELEFFKKDGTQNLVASPVYQTQALESIGVQLNGCTQEHDECKVFSREYFAPFNGYGFGAITPNTFSIHQYAATWYDEEQMKQKEHMIDICNFISERMLLR